MNPRGSMGSNRKQHPHDIQPSGGQHEWDGQRHEADLNHLYKYISGDFRIVFNSFIPLLSPIRGEGRRVKEEREGNV